MREIIENRPYIHFKDKRYYVHKLVIHSETGEKLVSYQCLYPPYEYYVRPLNMFLEKIDRNRPDNLRKQDHRFELFQ